MSSLNKKSLRIGVTGGIGCGKTTVLKEFAKLGVPCFVCDKVASAYYEDSVFLAEIRTLFGDDVFLQDGSVDKSKIAAIVFSNKQKLEELNQLVHPRVRADFEKWADAQTSKYVIMESAILFEHGLNELMDAVVSVYVSEEERIQRLLYRDGTSVESLKARMRNQMSAEEKMEKADWVVLNYEGNPRQRQVKYIDSKIRNIR